MRVKESKKSPPDMSESRRASLPRGTARSAKTDPHLVDASSSKKTSSQNSKAWRRPRATQERSVKNKTRDRRQPQCERRCEAGEDDQRDRHLRHEDRWPAGGAGRTNGLRRGALESTDTEKQAIIPESEASMKTFVMRVDTARD